MLLVGLVWGDLRVGPCVWPAPCTSWETSGCRNCLWWLWLALWCGWVLVCRVGWGHGHTSYWVLWAVGCWVLQVWLRRGLLGKLPVSWGMWRDVFFRTHWVSVPVHQIYSVRRGKMSPIIAGGGRCLSPARAARLILGLIWVGALFPFFPGLVLTARCMCLWGLVVCSQCCAKLSVTMGLTCEQHCWGLSLTMTNEYYQVKFIPQYSTII